VLAAWLPFSVLYLGTATLRSGAAPVTTVIGKSGTRVITTRTSGGQLIRTVVPAGASAPVQTSAVPVVTRVSG
jgi:hypothetical protein